ncbi:MAG: arginine--tRNA ligase [Candidatus Jorgensenbacteria bacterium]
MRNKIIGYLKKIVPKGVEIDLSVPESGKFGHYSTSIAFGLSKQEKKSPKVVAEEIVQRLKKAAPKGFFRKIEIVNGFINLWIGDGVFYREIVEVLKKKGEYGRNNNLKGQKTIVEYTDPNPFKEFHIGHLMPNVIGEAVSRLVEWNGAKVRRACYQGDVGLHVAKAVWGLQKSGIKKIVSVSDLAKAYALGTQAYETADLARSEINTINKKIYERSDKEINRLYDAGRKLSLKYFEGIYKKLGTKFDYYFFESESGEHGKKTVLAGLKKGIFEKSDGAIVFRGEKYGLHTRVFINTEGLPTYEAKELGLAEIKYRKYAYDKSIIVTGNEVNDYFRVLLKAMAEIFPKLAERTEHLSHGMMRLASGKISSRTGEVITAESLIDKVEKLVAGKMKNEDLSVKEKNEVKEKVAIAALKYSILKQAIGGSIIFDFGKSISFEGDSGPYLQYAYVRAKSVLEKAKQEKINASLKRLPEKISEIEPVLARFPEIVERAGRDYAPQYLSTYLIELARIFNSYYAKVKIVKAGDKESPYRVALTSAFSEVMRNGLRILGISVPEKM